MVQIVGMGKTPQGMLAESLGQALGEFGGTVGGEKLGYERRRGRLQEAFSNLDPNKNFIEQLRAIAPTLLSTEGGAQALGELSPILGDYAKTQAAINYFNNKKNKGNQPQAENQPQIQGMGQGGQSQGQGLGRPQQTRVGENRTPSQTDPNYTRAPLPNSPENTFPERTTGPQPVKLLTPDEYSESVNDLVQESLISGKPISFTEAENIIRGREQQKEQYNEKLQLEKDRTKAAQSQITQDIVQRAVDSNLVTEPEDRAVAEQLALQAKGAANDVERWNYVKQGMTSYKNARRKIQSELGRADPLTNLYRFANGTYKDRQQVIKNIQPQIEIYKKYGLVPELRNDLRTNLGWGAEDIETAIYPFTGQAKEQVDKFPVNPATEGFSLKKISPILDKITSQATPKQMQPEDFYKFKDQLNTYLNNNPDVNLIALRGNLVDDKGYDWRDYSTALSELINEGRYEPGEVQLSNQIPIIDQAPLPGLAAFFRFGLTGAK